MPGFVISCTHLTNLLLLLLLLLLPKGFGYIFPSLFADSLMSVISQLQSPLFGPAAPFLSEMQLFSLYF